MSGGYDRFFKEAQKAKGLAGSAKEPKFKIATRKPASPEERLREELTRRIRVKKRAAMKKKKLPVYPAVVAGMAFVACALAYQYGDELDQWLAKVEIGVFGSARAANPEEASAKNTAPGAPAKSSQDGREGTAKAAESKGSIAAREEASPQQWTAEEMSFFSKLNERKKELDLREAELVKLEEELQKRKQELDEKIKTLEAMRGEISKTLETRVANDQTKVDKLVQVYSGMKPVQAAKVIETLNEDLAVEVLDKMKKKSAAEILDVMDAKKARRLSEMLTGYEKRSLASEEAPATEAPARAAEGEGN